jgi:hypothetical protein
MPQAQPAQNDGLGVSPNDAPEVPPNAGYGRRVLSADLCGGRSGAAARSGSSVRLCAVGHDTGRALVACGATSALVFLRIAPLTLNGAQDVRSMFR